MTNDEQAGMPTPHWQRRTTLILTNLTKLAGLVVGLHEALTTKDPATMVFAAFLIQGARVSENVILGFLDRFFGREVGQE